MRATPLAPLHNDYGIRVGGTDYTYKGQIPKGCVGQTYRAHRFVLDVPTYQWKVLVEALTGQDAGLWFTCTPANFAMCYQPKPEGNDNAVTAK